jgi:hypothetical protein
MSFMAMRAGDRDARGLTRVAVAGAAVCVVAMVFAGAGAGSLVAGAWAGEACPNAALRTGLSAGLPDCRAFEQVSPTGKEGGVGGVTNNGYPGAEGDARPLLVSADGSAVVYPGEPFFEPSSSGNENVYTSVRSAGGWGTVNGDTLGFEPVPVPVVPPFAGARVLEETPDGSKVFFADEAHGPGITGDSNAAVGEPDLYQYDVATGQATDLTVDASEHPDVRGIMGIGGEGSEEGSYVYFVAGGSLAAGATPGGDNLYLRHNGNTRFIAALSPVDDTAEHDALTSEPLGDWSALPTFRTAEVSPSGQYVAFGSVSALTGQAAAGAEVFRYAAGTGSLVCVSCSPTGAVVPQTRIPYSFLAGINGANRRRYVLNDGRVFFTTTAALVAQDRNGEQDVYEWEDEAPHLISPGTSGGAFAVFAGASASGSDVFFTTRQSLLPGDGDEINDMYDAREEGGFPPASPPVGCALGEACPGAGSAAPVLGGAPVSMSFSGSEGPPPAVVVKPPVPVRRVSGAQKLARALKGCRAQRSRRARVVCERTARRRYGPGGGNGKKPMTGKGR